MSATRRVTAADVARVAQVSTATVSLIVNGKAEGRVSPKTCERVLAAVDELGYRVDAVARSLATGRRYSVALVVPDIANPYFSQVTKGVAERLGADYQLCLIIADATQESFPANLDQVVAERVDGILAEAPAIDLLERLKIQSPIIVLDRPEPHVDLPYVGFDLDTGSAALASHLIDLGHRRIAYLDAEIQGLTFDVRRTALARRLNATIGREFVGPVVAARTDIDAAAEAFATIWDHWREVGVTAIVCAADIHAYGVLRAAKRLGVDVPGELSVAAFDDLPFSAIVDPPLTTVALSAFDLGFHAAGLLSDLMEDRPRAAEYPPLPATLRVRGTTGPVSP